MFSPERLGLLLQQAWMEGANRHLVRCTSLLPLPKKWLLRSKSGVGWMESRLRLVRGRRGGDLGRINGPQLAISSRASHYFSLSLSFHPHPALLLRLTPALKTYLDYPSQPPATQEATGLIALCHTVKGAVPLFLYPLWTHTFLGQSSFCLCIVTHIRS